MEQIKTFEQMNKTTENSSNVSWFGVLLPNGTAHPLTHHYQSARRSLLHAATKPTTRPAHHSPSHLCDMHFVTLNKSF